MAKASAAKCCKLAVVCGAYPPQLDGIGDHTRLLATELQSHIDVFVVTSGQMTDPSEGTVVVHRCFTPGQPRSIRNAIEVLEREGASEVLLQYNPFGFGRRGFNPWLAPALRAWRRRDSDRRISVLLHETHVPPHGWRNLLMLTFQFPQFAAICRLADHIFVAAGRWAEQVRRITPVKNPIHLPAGSNLPAATSSFDTARAAMGIAPETILLGMFGSAHVSRLLDWIGAAAADCERQLSKVCLLNIGPDGKSLAAVVPRGIEFRDAGRLDAADAADHLAALDLLLAPFIDGLSTRRGSVMAALQNGVPVASTSTAWTDPVLCGQDGIFLAPVEAGSPGFSHTALRALTPHWRNDAAREPLRAFYRSHFDWPVLADILLRTIKRS